jgi:zeaxanthin glucosyltransferase
MKQRVVFLFYHGFGHINSFLKAARILDENNYEVWFAGSGFFREHIALQGRKFYLLKSYPFGVGLEKWINTVEGKNSIYPRELWDRINDRVFIDRQVDLYWMLEEIRPNLILLDKMLSTDFIVLYSHLKNRGIRIGIVNTMLPTQINRQHPPLNSDTLPTNPEATAKAIRKATRENLKKKWKQKLMMFGFDDSFIVNRRIQKNNIPKHYVSADANILRFTLQDVAEFILAPYEFDFYQSFQPTREKYVGFMTCESRVEIADEAYQKSIARILTEKKGKNLRLVYCSFGTIAPEKKFTATFIQNLASLAAEGEYIVVLSGTPDIDILNERPANFHAFETVPQLQILKHSDVFITHGGLNSIKEAVYAEVPMLVYPVHPQYDPVGNAARVFYHRLGLRGDIASESIDELKAKITELLSNKMYIENIRRLKHIDSTYNESTFLSAIDHIESLE